ncbi:Bacterial alpha-L-rhamnosidase [Mucilaginibacter corticis]|uniref:Bacterial alpha-L-rhamnosidase n=2 Tax=Mucilaginibacter corticis TaxID=2597670 RepID=A0A556MXX4_9SPHI|nr:Bacterial alpha-L-rhamnosidase [Mucilaginibacter corticis]
MAALACFFYVANLQAQPYTAQAHKWSANWIAMPDEAGTAYGIYYFRKNLTLDQKPGAFVVHVSADNRYKLYVNEQLVAAGPARGDNFYWNYETVDLAPYLKTGKNTIAALVFNEAQYRPTAQISYRTGFLLQGETPEADIANTNYTWKCTPAVAHQPYPGYFPIMASKGEIVDMHKETGDWRKIDFDDSKWTSAAQVLEAQPKGKGDGFGWMLVQSPLPQMEMRYQRISTLRKVSGMEAPAGFPKTKGSVTIPAKSTVQFLLDQDTLTNAYITLNLSGGEGSTVKLRYAETLYDKDTGNGRLKGNRNDVEGKDFLGRADSIIANGKPGQTFTTLYWRTYRYLQVTVKTGDEPLVIDDLYGTFTGYPFKMRASLSTDNAEMKNIMAIGWRTARLCAIETYFDCPYYEQLQYIGDTRIQAMVSYYNAGNDTLARNAINQIDHSRLPDGVTQSRWPSKDNQVIPGFSLWYIGMLHDYWTYRNDKAFIKEKLTSERAILGFFDKYRQADGSLKNVPFWLYEDWVNGHGWDWGSPHKTADGNSALLDLQLLWAYKWAAEMEADLGMPAFAADYRAKAAQLTATIQTKYWSESKQLYAETSDKTTFSQHINSLAILTGIVPKEKWAGLADKILNDATLAPCSIYFKYYMHMALVKAGLGNQYLSWLGVWRDDMQLGLSTWGEEPDPQRTRSDCHAWGASPNVEFYRTLLGIDSDAPGFQKIRITPRLGDITNIAGTMPHPNGKVSVAYKLNNNNWNMSVDIPLNTTGVFVWKNKEYTLMPGQNSFVFSK